MAKTGVYINMSINSGGHLPKLAKNHACPCVLDSLGHKRSWNSARTYTHAHTHTHTFYYFIKHQLAIIML